MELDTFVALVQEVPAPGGPAGEEPGPLSSIFVPLAVMAVLFYIILLGPERKQRKQREAMLGAVKKGDKVVTTSGIHAQVAAVGEDVVTLQIADGVRVKFSRQAIQQVLGAPGEEKAPAEAAAEKS